MRLDVEKKNMLSGFFMAHLLEYILINCINYFLIAVTKHLTKKQLEEGLILAHSSEDYSPSLSGKAWQQELETTDHTASRIWKEIDMNTGTHLAFSIFLSSSSYPSP